jgi:hypothetical protein
MVKGRLEAFSDGVLAIIITIMVLELKTPHEVGLAALRSLIPVFFSYVLSFIYVGIYWNNHHHLLQVTRRVNGSVLLANLHLLHPACPTGLSGNLNHGPMGLDTPLIIRSGPAYCAAMGSRQNVSVSLMGCSVVPG